MAFNFRREAFDPKLMALAKFFADMGARNNEETMLKSRMDYAASKDKEKFDREEAAKTQLAEQMAAAIRQMYPENRPDVETETVLPTTALGDLSSMAGVSGAGTGLIGPEPPIPTTAPTVPGATPMSGMIGETRKMTSEEILPELMAKLAAARVPAADMQRIYDTLVSRNDYNVARGAGLGGEKDASPYQAFSADAAESDVNYKDAQSINLLSNASNTVDPNAGMFATLTDKNGQIIGFYNPKTDVFKENPVEGSRRSGLPTAELNRRGMLTTIKSQLDRVSDIAEKNKDSIGGVFGWRGKVTALKNAVGGADPDAPLGMSVSDEESQMLRELSNIGDMILRARSGAQINEQEAKRLQHLVPQIGSPDFWSRLASFRNEIETLIGATVEDGGIKSVNNPTPATNTSGDSRGTTDDFDAWLATSKPIK